jgi:hypothetical protein
MYLVAMFLHSFHMRAILVTHYHLLAVTWRFSYKTHAELQSVLGLVACCDFLGYRSYLKLLILFSFDFYDVVGRLFFCGLQSAIMVYTPQ